MKARAATLEKAKRNNVNLEPMADGTWLAEHKDGKSKSHHDPKKALDAVLEIVKKPATKTTKTLNEPKKSTPKLKEVEKTTKSVVKQDYKNTYKNNGGNCGDDLANALRAARESDSKAFTKICAENGIDAKKWSHLKNEGLKWMALSNSLRAPYKHGIAVFVLKRQFKT